MTIYSPAHRRAPAGQPLHWLLGAAGISSLGDGLAVVALPILATRLTTDPRLIAGLLFAQRLPWLGLSLPAGALADRFPRIRLMRIADLVRAAVLVGAGIGSMTGQLALPALYLLALALGSADTVFSTASQATLPDLVVLDELDRANGRLFSVQTAGEQLLGPVLGGLVLAASSSAPLLIDACSFGASALLLSHVAARRAPRPVAPLASISPSASNTGIRAGIRAFAGVPVLRVLLVLLAGLSLCQAMVLALLVVFATRTLHLGPAGYGLFIAAGSTGNVAGGIAVARIRQRVGSGFVMTGSAIAAAGAYLILAMTSSPVVAVGAFVVESFAVACGCVASLTMRQSAVSPELRGRISSIFRLAIYGSVPLGALAGGLLAAAGGLRLAFVVAGCLQLTLAVATAGPLRRRILAPATRPLIAPTIAVAA